MTEQPAAARAPDPGAQRAFAAHRAYRRYARALAGGGGGGQQHAYEAYAQRQRKRPERPVEREELEHVAVQRVNDGKQYLHSRQRARDAHRRRQQPHHQRLRAHYRAYRLAAGAQAAQYAELLHLLVYRYGERVAHNQHHHHEYYRHQQPTGDQQRLLRTAAQPLRVEAYQGEVVRYLQLIRVQPGLLYRIPHRRRVVGRSGYAHARRVAVRSAVRQREGVE